MSGTRCGWVSEEAIYVAYHDDEWGVPNGDSRALFEKIILEGFQAGLSWITILRKREHFRRVFDNFNPEAIAHYGPEKIAGLLADPGIIRNRLKVEAAVANAQAYLKLSEKQSLASFLWHFVDGKPIQNRFASLTEIPPETSVSSRRLQGPEDAGIPFRRPDHRLCDDAVRRHGQRPHCQLLPTRRLCQAHAENPVSARPLDCSRRASA